jgi:hypothetical protein
VAAPVVLPSSSASPFKLMGPELSVVAPVISVPSLPSVLQAVMNTVAAMQRTQNFAVEITWVLAPVGRGLEMVDQHLRTAHANLRSMQQGMIPLMLGVRSAPRLLHRDAAMPRRRPFGAVSL